MSINGSISSKASELRMRSILGFTKFSAMTRTSLDSSSTAA